MIFQFVNYALENLKWRTVLTELRSFDFIKTQKAVYAGNAVAIFTPDRLGTFIGRFTYLKEVSKTKITYSTFVGNYAQLVTTVVFALIGLTLSWNMNLDFHFPKQLSIQKLTLILIPVTACFIFILYHQISILLLLEKLKSKYLKGLIEKLSFMKSLQEKNIHEIFGWAALRYLTFVLQFHLALKLFGSDQSFIWSLAFCGVLYLFATIIPSPFMGNLGTREAVAVFLLSTSDLTMTVVAASLLIWLINVVLPSIIGGLILLKK